MVPAIHSFETVLRQFRDAAGGGSPAQSPTVMAAVQLIGVSAEAQLLASELQYAELRLHQLRVSRPRAAPLDPPWSPQAVSSSPQPGTPPAAAAAGSSAQRRSQPKVDGAAANSPNAGQEVFGLHPVRFGLHPVRSGRQSAADMPLALWMQWQAGQQDSEGSSSAAKPPSMSLRIGKLFAAHVPCFLEEMQRWFVLERPASGNAAEAAGAAQPPPQPCGNGALQQPEAAAAPPLLARLLAADASADLAISAVQIALLAAADAPAEAVVLNVAKISGQLGPIKSRAHSVQHSMAAALLQQVKGSPPAHGLRLALSGLQISSVSMWPATGGAALSQHSSGNSSPAVVTSLHSLPPASPPLRAQPVSSLANLQLLMAACSSEGIASTAAGSAPAPPQAAADSWAAWAVLSPMSLQSTAAQLAAVSAAIGGLSAASVCTLQPVDTAGASYAAALGMLSISLASTMQLTYSPLGAAAVSAAAAAEHWLPTASSLAMATETLEVAVAGSAGGHVRLACHHISAAAAPGFGLRLPIIEAGFAPPPGNDSSLAGASASQRQGSMPCRLTGFAVTQHSSGGGVGGGSGLANAGADAEAHSSSDNQLTLQLHSFSAQLAPYDLRSALEAVYSLTSASLLPPHTSYTAPLADGSGADCGSELAAKLGAALITVHATERQGVEVDSMSLSLAGASYLHRQVRNAAISCNSVLLQCFCFCRHFVCCQMMTQLRHCLLQEVTGDSSAMASVTHFECCTYSAMEAAFASFLRYAERSCRKCPIPPCARLALLD